MKFVVIAIFLVHTSLLAQTDLKINASIHGEEIVLGREVILKNSDTLVIHTLRFYITNLHFQTIDKTIISTETYLIDLEEKESMIIHGIPVGTQNIQFLLGTDSLTNVSGILNGPLDPINGMYWAWNSGYINFKLEGTLSSLEIPKHEFEFHIGGYQHPFSSARSIVLSADPSFDGIEDIDLDLGHLFESVDWKTSSTIMSPGPKAVEISDSLQKCFSISHHE